MLGRREQLDDGEDSRLKCLLSAIFTSILGKLGTTKTDGFSLDPAAHYIEKLGVKNR
jgi:hypothetical protein